MNRTGDQVVKASVIDLFCGAGGLSHGFFQEGFDITAGVDIDEDCQYAFETNNKAKFIRKSVADLTAVELAEMFRPDGFRILVGCAPCQPFSKYNQRNNDPGWQLLEEFARLVEDSRPDIVSMENVPQLSNFKDGALFEAFVTILHKHDYHVAWDILYGPDYGLPQRRSRLVLIASRLGQISLPEPICTAENHMTVAEAIAELPSLEAGAIDPDDRIHKSSRLSMVNMSRIRASRPGGSWNDWPEDIVAECHKRETGHTYGSVYGRMEWSKPSPTITTQFFGFGNGRFGHPEQDRAISLREGAILQSFPQDYQFVEPGKPIHMRRVGRMIGNAVPVVIGRAIARSIRTHLEACT